MAILKIAQSRTQLGRSRSHHPERGHSAEVPSVDILAFQHTAGNRAIAALLCQNLSDSGNNDSELLRIEPMLNDGDSQPIDPHSRLALEARFGHDFTGVRVHTGAAAADSAKALQAKAYTVGQHVVFGEGRYAPTSDEGKRLLVHELAHVIQQERGGAPPPLDAFAPHELAANQAATSVLRGQSRVSVSGATGVGIARDPEDDVNNKAGAVDPEVEKAFSSWDTPSPTDRGPGTRDPADKSLELAADETRLVELRKQLASSPDDKLKKEYATKLRQYHEKLDALEQEKWTAATRGQQELTPEDLYTKLIAMRGFDYSLSVHELQAVKARLRDLEAKLKAKPDATLQKEYNKLRDAYLISSFGGGGAPAGAGYNTYAIVQVVGKDGKVLALAAGKYTGGKHAEEIAIARLKSQLAGLDDATLEGARIVVVGDKVICSDVCRPALSKLAVDLKANEVEGHVFRRPKLKGEGEASEKTTSRTATVDTQREKPAESKAPLTLKKHSEVVYRRGSAPPGTAAPKSDKSKAPDAPAQPGNAAPAAAGKLARPSSPAARAATKPGATKPRSKGAAKFDDVESARIELPPLAAPVPKNAPADTHAAEPRPPKPPAQKIGLPAATSEHPLHPETLPQKPPVRSKSVSPRNEVPEPSTTLARIPGGAKAQPKFSKSTIARRSELKSAGVAVGGELLSSILTMVANHYLQKFYEKKLEEQAEKKIRESIESQKARFESIINASKEKIEDAQAEGRRVSLHVTLELHWQEGRGDPESGLSIGNILMDARVVDVQVILEGEKPVPYELPQPEGVLENVGWFLKAALHQHVGTSITNESSQLDLEGTNEQARRLHEIDALLRTVPPGSEAFSRLQREREDLLPGYERMQRERQKRKEMEQAVREERKLASEKRDKAAEEQRKKEKLQAFRAGQLAPTTPAQSLLAAAPTPIVQPSKEQNSPLGAFSRPRTPVEQSNDVADIFEGQRSELVERARQLATKSTDNRLSHRELRQYRSERDTWIAQLRQAISMLEQKGYNPDALRRLKQIDDWIRNTGSNALLP